MLRELLLHFRISQHPLVIVLLFDHLNRNVLFFIGASEPLVPILLYLLVDAGIDTTVETEETLGTPQSRQHIEKENLVQACVCEVKMLQMSAKPDHFSESIGQ